MHCPKAAERQTIGISLTVQKELRLTCEVHGKMLALLCSMKN